jgi:hypothetical protein
LVPVIARLVILNVALPLLVRVIIWAALVVPRDWLPKGTLVGERLTAGAMPVPARLSDWGLPAALSVNTTEAVRVPGALGVNVALRVH